MRLTLVGKRYARHRWVLSGVDLDVPAGRIIAISGPNGAGKSTLLNIMAGITRPTTGRVTGRPTSIGYVPERFPVRTQLSALGYLRHMGRVRGLSTTAATRRATSFMERFQLTEADTPLRQLSKGNAQRVGLIQALLVRPDLLILDEPANGLDELGHELLTEIVREVAREGGAVVLGSPLRFGAPTGAVGYELRGGRLSTAPALAPDPPSSGNGPAVRIVLRPGPDAGALPAALMKVLSARSADADSTATIPTAISDRMLEAALRNGWSVVSVTPVHARSAERSAEDPGGGPSDADGSM